ncbi:type II secretion system F family protein [Pseudoalteromonas sp. SWXJZ94C]|uniref:type II secretion system F family protein n=1 Tax=unclassified Pseudoalteromonas TaxID=194690 RepID=UPI0003FEFFD4|nr:MULTISPECIES: type II secretion system F family protein [unclassified Pseudoalteromonas]MBH0056322.1 type II secretion system F family protein [Pseudoalteromonas sp. SWXJZ94C]
MTKLDYLLAIATVITFTLAASVFITLYVKKNASLNIKKIDILEEKDVLTLSLRVLGLNISNAWFISMAFSLSSSSWFIAKLYYPQASTSAFIVSIVVFITCFITVIDIAHYKLAKFEYQFLEYIETIQSCLSTGLSLQQSMKFADEHADRYIKKQSTLLLQRMSMGSDAETSFTPLIERYNCETVRLFAHSVITHTQSQCDLTDMLKSVCKMMALRTLERQQLEAKLSGTKYAAVFSGVLPYALIPLFSYTDPTWFDPLLNDPNGIAFITVALICQLFGFLWLRLSLRVTL